MPPKTSHHSGNVKKRRRRLVDKKLDLQSLVKDGVEEFILRHATINEFWKSMHSASRKEKVYSHQLTGSVLTRIVKLAVQQRKKELATSHKELKGKGRGNEGRKGKAKARV